MFPVLLNILLLAASAFFAGYMMATATYAQRVKVMLDNLQAEDKENLSPEQMWSALGKLEAFEEMLNGLPG